MASARAIENSRVVLLKAVPASGIMLSGAIGVVLLGVSWFLGRR